MVEVTSDQDRSNESKTQVDQTGSENDRPDSLLGLQVDYVIVFSLKPIDGKKIKDRLAHGSQLKKEYLMMMDRLKNAGLTAISRPGSSEGSSDEILVLIYARDETIIQREVQAERLADWLHGITSIKPEPGSNQTYTPAERLRHIYNIITQENDHQSSSSSESPISPHPHRRSIGKGAGIIPNQSPFPQIKSIFPPHDLKFNQTWISNWNDRSHLSIRIPPSELDQIKDIYGDSIGYYFAFLDFYFQALIFPALLGLSFWLIGFEFSSVYSIILLTWSISFIESWKVKERLLAIKWNSFSCHKVEKSRVQFKPERMIVHSVTKEMVGYFPWWKRQYRMLFTFPVLILFGIGISGIITAITALELVMAEVYAGPFKQALALLPTVLFAAAVPQMVGLWQSTAIKLASWENHSFQTTYDRSLTLKIFTVHGLVAYSGLLLTSFVYVPFGSLLVPHLANLTQSLIKQKSVPLEGSPDKYMNTSTLNLSTYSINYSRLYQQLFAYMVTNQVVDSFNEVGLPYVKKIVSFKWKKILDERSKVQAGKKSSDGDKSSKKEGGGKTFTAQGFYEDREDEKELLERIRDESRRPEYHLFVEYAEMAIQFGYVVLWTVIWPISPLFSFVNNFFELRTDSIKLTKHSRRPVPTRSDSIGPWLDVLSTLSWLGAIINSLLVCLFKPSHDYQGDDLNYAQTINNEGSNNLSSSAANISLRALNKSTITANLFVSAIRNQRQLQEQQLKQNFQGADYNRSTLRGNDKLNSILFSIVLPMIFSEHLFLMIRFVIQEFVNRLMWINSDGNLKKLRAEFELKQNFVDRLKFGEQNPQGKQEQGVNGFDFDNEKKFKHEKNKKIGDDYEDERKIRKDFFWDRSDDGIEIIERFTKTE